MVQMCVIIESEKRIVDKQRYFTVVYSEMNGE